MMAHFIAARHRRISAAQEPRGRPRYDFGMALAQFFYHTRHNEHWEFGRNRSLPSGERIPDRLLAG